MCSIIFQCLLHPNPPTSALRLTITWVQTLNMSLIHLHGGMSGTIHSHNYCEWHLTIYLYQVRSIGTSPIFIDAFTATSIDVKQLFGHGCLLLSHVQSQLSAQSTCTLICLGTWSKLNLIKDSNMKQVTGLQDIDHGWGCWTGGWLGWYYHRLAVLYNDTINVYTHPWVYPWVCSLWPMHWPGPVIRIWVFHWVGSNGSDL